MNTEYTVKVMRLAPEQEVVRIKLNMGDAGWNYECTSLEGECVRKKGPSLPLNLHLKLEHGEYAPLTEDDAKVIYLYTGLKFKSFDNMTEQDLKEAKAKYAAYMAKRKAAHKEAKHWEVYLKYYKRDMPYIVHMKHYRENPEDDATFRLRIPTIGNWDILESNTMRGSFDEDAAFCEDGIPFALEMWPVAPLRKVDADLLEIYEGTRYKSAEEMSPEEEAEFRNYRVNNEVAPDIEEPDNCQKPDTCIILPNSTEEIDAPDDLKLETGLTIIFREYRKCHRVVVTDNMEARFLYRGTAYKTLAEIAQRINQAPVSGSIFFSLPFTECFI
ncbi:MAG: hypothetical protein R3Y56_09855 [Akkermansia sp.]